MDRRRLQAADALASSFQQCIDPFAAQVAAAAAITEGALRSHWARALLSPVARKRGVYVPHDPAPRIFVNGLVWQQVLQARPCAVGALNASLQVLEIQILVASAQVRLRFGAFNASDFAIGQKLHNPGSG